MADLFLSYAREDREHAHQLANALETHGLSVWWDREIPAGRAYDDVIEEAIDGARAVVVMWSPRSVGSDWVRTEAQEGADRGVLVPVVIEDAKIPLAFRRIQTARLAGWRGDASDPAFERLVIDIQNVLGGGTLAVPTPAADSFAAEPDEFSVERLTSGLADRFEIQDEIGAGGMAIVYRARDIKHDRTVAIKIMRPELAVSLASERFLREIRIAANLTHPHILPVHDSGDANGVLYYVMPFVEGESLQAVLEREGALPFDVTIDVMRDVAGALQYAHDKGVVHRDLKPDNILIAEGRAVLADFGIARAVQVAEKERLTGMGMSIGTPEFMSPEQASGDPDVDHRADIYSLGVMAYTMLAGRVPFSGTTQEIIVKHISEDPVPITTERPDTPAALAAAVMTCLEKRPDDRWSSARELVATLEGRDAVAPAPTRRWVSLVAGAAAVVLAGLGLRFAIGGDGSNAPVPIAVLPCENRSASPEEEFRSDGFARDLNTRLHQFGGFAVVAHGSAKRANDRTQPYRDRARDLNVDYVVDCSVQRIDDRMHVSASLIDPPTARQIWTDIYDRGDSVAAVSDIQTQIVARLADALNVQQSSGRSEELPTADRDAYDAYLRGRFDADKGLGQSDLTRAVRHFDEAISLDSGFALAYAVKAQVLTLQATITDAGPAPNPIPLYDRAQQAAERALELDTTLGDAHAALGLIMIFRDLDIPSADRHLAQALRLSPESPDVQAWAAASSALLGRFDEGLAASRRAIEISPISPWMNFWHGTVHLWAGNADSAVATFERVLEIDSTYMPGYGGMIEALSARGDYEAARTWVERIEGISVWRLHGIKIERQLGNMAEARRQYDEIQVGLRFFGDAQWIDAVQGFLSWSLGDQDEAFAHFERAVEQGAVSWVAFLRSPVISEMWSDPRLRDILRQLGLDITAERELIPYEGTTPR